MAMQSLETNMGLDALRIWSCNCPSFVHKTATASKPPSPHYAPTNKSKKSQHREEMPSSVCQVDLTVMQTSLHLEPQAILAFSHCQSGPQGPSDKTFSKPLFLSFGIKQQRVFGNNFYWNNCTVGSGIKHAFKLKCPTSGLTSD